MEPGQTESRVKDKEVSFGEMLKAVEVVEDIAGLRTTLEEEIFDKRLSPDQWVSFLEKTLHRSPNLIKYMDLFKTMVDYAKDGHDQLDIFWSSVKDSSDLSTGTPGFRGFTEGASGSSAAWLFRSLFGFFPESGIEAAKGVTSLLFTLTDSDFQKALKESSDDALWKAGVEFRMNGFKFSVILIRQKVVDEVWIKKVLPHEVEHSKNSILGGGRVKFSGVDEHLRGEDLDQWQRKNNVVFRELERLKDKANVSEEKAKNEILAYFTELENIEYRFPRAFEDFLDDSPGEFVKELSSESGHYYQEYIKSDKSFDKDRYVSSVERGANALAALARLYYQEEVKKGSVRMAMNVLEQFPLHRWPAVVYLINRRHNQQKEEKEEPLAA